MRHAEAPRNPRLAARSLLDLPWQLLVAAALSTASCATPQAPTVPGEERSSPPVLTEDGKRYLENLYLFTCASEYVPYPDELGPEVPTRSEAEWRKRREELSACREEVARRYTTPEAVRALTWNGSTHTMSDAERRGIVLDGPSYLEGYVDELLQRERSRERLVRTVAEETTP
jgi:hypothetical protein